MGKIQKKEKENRDKKLGLLQRDGETIEQMEERRKVVLKKKKEGDEKRREMR